jgi:hypothetical protein
LKDNQFVGHVITGHGDYEGKLVDGFSEMAVVIKPEYWNSDFKDEGKGIGIKGQKGIGTEVVRAAVAYAKALSERSIRVPSDAEGRDRFQLEAVKNVHRNAQGEIDWVYLPFTELRATAPVQNLAGTKIMQKVFELENNAAKTTGVSPGRDLFQIAL